MENKRSNSKGRMKLWSAAMAALLALVPVGQASASSASFPIGIFFPPSQEHTTSAAYADIAAMNANVVIGAAVIVTPEHNAAALDLAEENGLEILATDFRLHWTDRHVAQNLNGGGYFVSSGNRLGQTFKSPPTGTAWYITSVKLNIDKDYWPEGVTLTLNVYDSPAKNTLLGGASITGRPDTYFPTFSFSRPVQTDQSYYMELTSDSTIAIGWVATSTGDAYADGSAYQEGIATGRDLWFDVSFAQEAYNDGNRPTDAIVDTVADTYKSHPALLGYHLFDEPGSGLMGRIEAVRDRFRAQDPGSLTFVNLFPVNATQEQWGVLDYSGDFVRTNRSLGQTFRTSPGQTSLGTIQLWIDRLTWSAGESLTLKLWNSPAKQALLGSSTLASSADNFPVFTLNATVAPSTEYYWELTHGGGGDGSVGWVVQAHADKDWTSSGTGYANGLPSGGDYWFVVDQQLVGGSYEDYVYRWASKKPDVLAFDHYPFLYDGSFRNDYYTNLEVIRSQGLKAGVDFWSYMQSVGITGQLRQPTQAEMSYQIYTNLAYGAKGVLYFTYFTPGIEASGAPFFGGLILPDGTKNVTYGYAQGLNAELLKLGTTLTGLTSQEVYHTGTLPPSTQALPSGFFWQLADSSKPAVVGYFKDDAGRKYVMVVNRDYETGRTLSFSLPGKPSAVTEVSKSTGLEIATDYNSATGTLSASFAAGEGRLFALPSGY